MEKSIRLREGVEYLIRDGRLIPQPKRTLPAQPNWGESEQIVFRLDFDDPQTIRKSLLQGDVSWNENRSVMQTTSRDEEKESKLIYVLEDNEPVSLTPKTAIRFRYFFTDDPSGTFTFFLHNRTRDKTYRHVLVAPQTQHWTTFQAPLAELNCIGPGPDIAKTSQFGDQFDRIEWSLLGRDQKVMIDRLEFYELDDKDGMKRLEMKRLMDK